MQLLVLAILTLILNVLTNDIFIGVFTDSRNKVTIRPKFPSP